MKPSQRWTVIVVTAAAALATASILAVAAAGGAFGRESQSPVRAASACSVPALPGTVVDATLINMGGPMMGRPANAVVGGMMRLTLDRSTVDGIAPGGSSWVTVTLAAGRYEIVCNLPGHYAAGMYAQLTVT